MLRSSLFWFPGFTQCSCVVHVDVTSKEKPIIYIPYGLLNELFARDIFTSETKEGSNHGFTSITHYVRIM